MSSAYKNFAPKSVIKTLILCIITFGFFVSCRLYTLTKNVNPRINNPIPSWFMLSGLLVHLLSLVGITAYFSFHASHDILFYCKILHIVSSLYHVVWLFKIRNRINTLNKAKKGSSIWLNRLYITFLHVIYIQYKINQSVDINAKGAEGSAI